MKILELQQGSNEWLETRGKYHTASEAPAMMSSSSKASRNELLHMKATGDEKEFCRWVKEVLFANGHRVEAEARHIAEKIIGEELFPATAIDDNDYLLSSFDGITMLEDVCWECKQWNEQKAEVVRGNRVPEEDYWQVVQQLVISEADKLLYMVTDGTEENTVYTWFKLTKSDAKNLIAGWKQFDEDLANYAPVEKPAEVIPNQVKSLPSIRYELNGLVLKSNLQEYREAAEQLVNDAKNTLKTDQDFADAEVRIKAFKEAEVKLKGIREAVLGEIHDVDQFCRNVGDIGELIRQARLTSEKQIKNRKQEIRHEILVYGQNALANHIRSINKTLKSVVLPAYSVDFAAAMKGKRNIESLRGAVDDALAKAKIDINSMADEMRVNLKFYEDTMDGYDGYDSVFRDMQQIVTKPTDDFALIVTTRIEAEKQKEADRLKEIKEAEERKRKEEAARAGVDNSTPALHQKSHQSEAATVDKNHLNFTAQRPNITKAEPTTLRPTDNEIISVIALHYRVDESTVIQWLLEMDLNKSSETLVSNA